MFMLQALQGPTETWMGFGRIELIDGFAFLKSTFNGVVSLILQRVCKCVSQGNSEEIEAARFQIGFKLLLPCGSIVHFQSEGTAIMFGCAGKKTKP